MNHIATGRALSPGGELLPPHQETATAMKMAVESMEMAPGAIPHPGRVPEQRLLSPKLRLRWRRHCGTLSRKTLIHLGFSPRSEFIGEGAMSEGTRGPTPGGGAARGGPAPPGGVATSWPSSVSALDCVSCRGK
jgi:hypothetical protein